MSDSIPMYAPHGSNIIFVRLPDDTVATAEAPGEPFDIPAEHAQRLLDEGWSPKFNKLLGGPVANTLAKAADRVDDLAARLDPAGRARTLSKIAQIRGAIAEKAWPEARKLLVELQAEVDEQSHTASTLGLIQAARRPR